MSNAFGTASRVDFVNFLALVNRLVGTFGFAHIAIDALVCDQ